MSKAEVLTLLCVLVGYYGVVFSLAIWLMQEDGQDE